MSQSIFLICYDYIKNNPYNNYGDGNHIRIVWYCSNAVKTHNFLYIQLKFLTTGVPVTKTLIKYNSNNLKENDEEEKEPINLKLTEQKQILIMMKMLLILVIRLKEKDEEDIALASFSKSLQKQTDEENKKVTGWLFDDFGIVPNEKKN